MVSFLVIPEPSEKLCNCIKNLLQASSLFPRILLTVALALTVGLDFVVHDVACCLTSRRGYLLMSLKTRFR